MNTIDNKMRLKLVLIFIPVAFFSMFFHELGHWIVGELLGNDMALKLNGASPKSGHYVDSNHVLYITSGGPIFTIILTMIFWFVIEKHKIMYAYAVVFFSFLFRLFPQVLKFDFQDEAKVSVLLGIGKYTIPVIVLVLLFLITWRAGRVLKLNYKDNLLFAVVSIVCMFLVVITDELLF